MKLWMALCLFPVLCLAQPDFRADVHLVNVAFSVRDAAGKLVTSLTRDDFEVYEDGAPQKIAFFAHSEDVPLKLGLIVDMSDSQGSFLKPHQRDLHTFLHAALAPEDRAFLLCFGNHLRLAADFSGPERDLSAVLANYDKARYVEDYPELGPREIRTQGTAFFDAIYYASQEMLATPGAQHKALIVFSDGEDNSSAHNELDAIEAAQASNVLLFAVRYTKIEDHRLNSRNKYGISVMARMAKETGGADFDAKEKGLAEDFRQIGEQLRSAYELSYQSSNTTLDDTFHKIVIRPKDRSLTVRAKAGYYAK